MEEKELMAKLVDRYGFSYVAAQEIASEENASFILTCIEKGYQKGKSSYADSWQGGSYG